MTQDYLKYKFIFMTSAFSNQVYEILKKCPKGKVTTYQDLAHYLGSKAYRAVGSAMRRNPHIITTPCHRVVKSNGSLGNYNHPLGVQAKIKLLESEGIIIDKLFLKIVDFEKCLWDFK